MGLLIKSVRHLESARMVDTVVFDKTGTLTSGKLELEETLVHGEKTDATTALRIAAAIESRSNHPVARAISQAVSESDRPDVTGFTEHSGLGLEGEIDGEKSSSADPLSWRNPASPSALTPRSTPATP